MLVLFTEVILRGLFPQLLNAPTVLLTVKTTLVKLLQRRLRPSVLQLGALQLISLKLRQMNLSLIQVGLSHRPAGAMSPPLCVAEIIWRHKHHRSGNMAMAANRYLTPQGW